MQRVKPDFRDQLGIIGLKSERSVGLPGLLEKNYIRPALDMF